MPELSLIVPVYKVEKYLPRCIDSILAQTFRDFELILIDDGSPDNCGAICDEYAAQDFRIKVIHQENAGVSAARNAGLDIARGTYVGFVDADDWIEPAMYRTMLDIALKTKSDIVACGVRYFDESGVLIRSDLTTEGIYNSEDALATLYGMPNLVGGSSCNKLFLRAAIGQSEFPVGVSVSEDWLFLFSCYSLCSSMRKISTCLYNVVQRVGSATRDNRVDTHYENLSGSKYRLLKLARRYSKNLEYKATDKYLDDCLRYAPQMREIGQHSGQAYRMKMLHIKCLMLKVIARAYFHKLLPKAKIHGYIMGMIKL